VGETAFEGAAGAGFGRGVEPDHVSSLSQLRSALIRQNLVCHAMVCGMDTLLGDGRASEWMGKGEGKLSG
jgi:hypothetical protein